MDKARFQIARKNLNFEFQWRKLALYLLQDLGLWAATLILFQQPLVIAWLAVFPIAALMFRGFAFMHEATHGVAHSNYTLNYAFGLWGGIICFLPYTIWKSVHLEHHFWTGNYHTDPAMEIVKRYPNSSRFTKAVFTLMWKTRFPLLAFFQYIVFWGHCAVRLFKNLKDKMYCLSFILPCAAWGALAISLSASQLAILAGGVFVYSLLFDFINLPHHVGIYIHDEKKRNPTWEQHHHARTGRYSAALEYLILNFNFHAEHHMFPDLPWHELKKAHAFLHKNKTDENYHIIDRRWLSEKRHRSFSEFLRPDLHENSSLKKAA